MKIGFVGFGEAAYYISIGLKEQGVSGIIGFDVMYKDAERGKLIKKRAAEAGVQLLDSLRQVAENSDVLFVAVPSSNTHDVCIKVSKYLRAGMIYADVTASTPELKQKIWQVIKNKGVLFSDFAMMGPLPLNRHKVPVFASGNGTQALIDLMSPFGMIIKKVGEEPGEASAIKLIRSIYMKGVAALMIEMLQASEYYNVSERVISSVADTINSTDFVSTMNRLVTGTAIHSKRRSDELKGSIQMLDEMGLDCSMSKAAKNKHDLITAAGLSEAFSGMTPKNWIDVVKALK